MRVSAAVRTFALAVEGMALLCAAVDAREAPRFLPQLDSTDLGPRKVAFAPDDATLLIVVKQSGRIDLFDISNPDQPVKITEIGADASDAAFTPKGTARDKIKIISGGAHSTVRLWKTASLRPSRSRDTATGFSASRSHPTARASLPAARTARCGCGGATASLRQSHSSGTTAAS